MGKTVKTSLNPFVLSHDLYASIGEVVVAWSQLENCLMSGISFMLKTEMANSVAMTANMNVSAQIDSALTLCKMVVPEAHQKNLNGCLEKMRSMSRERNKIAHGRWQQTDKEHKAVCTTARAYGEPTEDKKLMTVRSMKNFAKQIRDLSCDLVSSYIEAGLFVPPCPLPPRSAKTIAL